MLFTGSLDTAARLNHLPELQVQAMVDCYNECLKATFGGDPDDQPVLGTQMNLMWSVTQGVGKKANQELASVAARLYTANRARFQCTDLSPWHHTSDSAWNSTLFVCHARNTAADMASTARYMPSSSASSSCRACVRLTTSATYARSFVSPRARTSISFMVTCSAGTGCSMEPCSHGVVLSALTTSSCILANTPTATWTIGKHHDQLKPNAWSQSATSTGKSEHAEDVRHVQSSARGQWLAPGQGQAEPSCPWSFASAHAMNHI